MAGVTLETAGTEGFGVSLHLPSDQLREPSAVKLPRAHFLGAAAAAAAFAAAPPARAVQLPHNDALAARDQTYARRVGCAAAQRDAFRESTGNGDEQRYADAYFIGSFSKGLPHDAAGRVDPPAYRSLMLAIATRNPAALDPRASKRLRGLLANVLSIDPEVAGCDPRGLAVAAAPALASRQTAADLVELYWLALTRDLPYADYATDAIVARACADIGATPATVFRGSGRGRTGPYLSQYLWLDVPQELDAALGQRRSTAMPGVDFVIDHQTWLAVQNGSAPFSSAPRAAMPRYLITGRDLADYLDKIRSAIAWENAASIISSWGPNAAGNFDLDDFHALFGMANSISGSAMFYQKMSIQRRARPDALGGLIARGRDSAPFDQSLWASPALDLIEARNGNRLLPQAYPYGTPPHPSYPAGHATLAGTGATILKALVNEDFVIERPRIPNAEGSALVDYAGPTLTVGTELDKLGDNCAYGRGTAGVHYRADSLAGLLLGEAAAISVLRDRAAFQDRADPGFRFTSFSGQIVHIPAGTAS